jgi:hypothetical protein
VRVPCGRHEEGWGGLGTAGMGCGGCSPLRREFVRVGSKGPAGLRKRRGRCPAGGPEGAGARWRMGWEQCGCPAGSTRGVGVSSAPPGWVVVGARRCGGNLCGSDQRAPRGCESGGGGALPAGQCGYRLLRRSGCSRRRAAGFRAGPVSEPGKAGRCRRVFAASRRSFRTGQINESERAGRAGVRGVAAGSSYRPGQRTGEGEAAPAGVHGIAAEFSYRPGQRTREGWTVPTGVRGVATEFPCRSGQRTSCEATSAGTS